jgi:AcrR family transcriptional regulator
MPQSKPEPSGWRTADVELTPILAASLEAFYENSYEGTTVRDIARRVGVTVPALYYHHVNKEAILYDLLDSAIEHLLRQTDEALTEAGPKSVPRFLNLVECIVLYMAHVTKLAHLDTDIRSLTVSHRKTYVGKRRAIEDLLRATIEAGVDGRDFDVTSPKDTARALLGMFQAIATWYQPEGDLGPRELVLIYLDISVHAVGAKPAVLKRLRGQHAAS